MNPAGGADAGGAHAPRLLFVVTEDWYFCSHRLALAAAAQAAGYTVHVATRVGTDGARIRGAGFTLHAVPFARSPRRPDRDLAALAALVRVYRRVRPHIVHHVALKPIVLGSLAAVWARPPLVVNALTGLGYVFSSPSGRARLLRPPLRLLLRWLLRREGALTVLQNADDRALLAGAAVIDPARSAVVRGSGVDLARFAPPARRSGVPLVVLAGRMLRDKGVEEFVAAARRLRAGGCAARFALVGGTDPDNPAALARDRLAAWHAEGAIEWWGRREDMPAVWAQAHVACLPSYREGLPMALLEAAAAGLALVATDVPGCREIVRHGDNGLLVPPGDPEALAAALARVLADASLRARMGTRSRALAADFAIGRVVRETLAVYRRFGAGAAPAPCGED